MQLFSEKVTISSEAYFSGLSYVKPSVHSPGFFLRCCGQMQTTILNVEEAEGRRSRRELALS